MRVHNILNILYIMNTDHLSPFLVHNDGYSQIIIFFIYLYKIPWI